MLFKKLEVGLRMNLNKYTINLIKLIFGLGIIYLIYNSIASEKNIQDLSKLIISLDSKSFILIAVTFLLMIVNWFIEALKFKYILKKKVEVSTKDAVKAIYIGNATGIFTPDRLGNFIGRFIYFSKIEKMIITSSTLLGNYTQLITTVTFALISAVLINTTYNSITVPLIDLRLILGVTIFVWTFLIYLFIYPTKYLKLIYKVKWIRKQEQSINYLKEFSIKESSKIIIYSIIRYIIFIAQFYLLLSAFGLNITILETTIFCGLLYLFTTLIPSPLMGNLGTREYISIILLSTYQNPEIALIASLSIWVINIAIPSIIGSYLLIKMNHNKTKG